MDEFALIKRYFQTPFNSSLDLTGGGDDCAVLSLPEAYRQVISVDTMVEGRHFPADMAAEDIAFRALAVAASDLAAMGAKPWWFTLALSLPEASEPWLKAFSEGLKTLADDLGIQLIGGDTTRGPLTVSVQVAGLLPLQQCLYRSTAKVGDIIAVTGTLGDSAGGLSQWGHTQADAFLRQRYARPTPRIDAGQKLLNFASSCVDISDGLLADAAHIAERSGVSMRINVEQLPISTALKTQMGEALARQYACSGGDDYELCFTIAPQQLALLALTDLSFRCIGEVRAGTAVVLVNNNGETLTSPSTGYNHFHD